MPGAGLPQRGLYCFMLLMVNIAQPVQFVTMAGLLACHALALPWYLLAATIDHVGGRKFQVIGTNFQGRRQYK
jgi:hypothetical protein